MGRDNLNRKNSVWSKQTQMVPIQLPSCLRQNDFQVSLEVGIKMYVTFP